MSMMMNSGKVLYLPFWEGEEGAGIHNNPFQDLRMGRGSLSPWKRNYNRLITLHTLPHP